MKQLKIFVKKYKEPDGIASGTWDSQNSPTGTF